jgi:hypothetical protein
MPLVGAEVDILFVVAMPCVAGLVTDYLELLITLVDVHKQVST